MSTLNSRLARLEKSSDRDDGHAWRWCCTRVAGRDNLSRERCPHGGRWLTVVHDDEGRRAADAACGGQAVRGFTIRIDGAGDAPQRGMKGVRA